jgi:hypothetical protein
MKNRNHKLYLTVLLAIAILAGCKKSFLDKQPQDTFVDANFYKTTDQVLAGTAPLYNKTWFDYNDKASHGIGDGRGGDLFSGSYEIDNIDMRTTSVTPEVQSSWQSFYNVVAQANSVILNVPKYAGPDVPASAVNYAVAEGRFMRGLAYYYLTSNWGTVPIITNNSAVLLDTTIRRNTVETIWQFIIKDMAFAAANLPAVGPQPGRLTKWAAEGMLSRMYLTRAGVNQSGGARSQSDLDSAALLALDVINNSGASLMHIYESLFLTASNNNSESLFALQWIYSGDYGSQNSVQAYLAFGSSITGFADGWGGDIGASKFIMDKYDPADVRRHSTYMFPGEHYSDIHQAIPDPANPGKQITQELQVPTNSTDASNVAYGNRAWVKKYIVGRPEDNGGQVQQQRTSINTYMLRLAEVFLIYAEAKLGNNASTTDPLALQYFNAVRIRAGITAKSSITSDDIFNERLLELAMEGQLWYDIVRLHYYNPAKALALISAQDRGSYKVYPNALTNATTWTVVSDVPAYYPVTDANFFLPYPSAELTIAPNLAEAPVPYIFK